MPRVNLGQNTWGARKIKACQRATEIMVGRKHTKKLSDTALAEICGLSRPTLNIMVNNFEKLRVEHLFELGRVLGFTAEDYAAIFAPVATKSDPTT